MKLFATLETSRGKVVSVSDNQEIIATVYDGNLKAYSVYIQFTIVGDPEHGECLECGSFTDDLSTCDQCGNNDQRLIQVVPAVMGAIVTTREWRNEPDERRKVKGK